MKKNDVLWTTNTGTNTSGFSALPGEYRGYNGSFGIGIGLHAEFLSATEFDYINVWGRPAQDFNGDVYRGLYAKTTGASVRCLRD
jgi:uncharacterized protein (TIGR02145 family)